MLLAIAVFFHCIYASQQWSIGQLVTTSSGPVQGHAAGIHPEVSEYLGIPWAAPPVGNLRFMPAQPFNGGNQTFVADKFGADCPTLSAKRATNSTGGSLANGVLTQLDQAGHNQSEDCLTLNVWTKPQTGEKKKAVLVWIYGGGFQSGASNNPTYNGQVFAEKQDIVLVSINYRLNVFGFPYAPGIPDLNLGITDQRKAIEWVRDNIESFGGDASRISIFGESAGSRAVDIYAYAWADAKDPIVNGFISESGSAPWTTGGKYRPDLWYDLSSRLGCGGVEKGNSTISCMQNKSTTEILEATKSSPGRAEIFRRFYPVPDEKVYFSDYDKRAKEGRFIQRPILIGNNDNESGLQALTAKAQGNPMSDEAKLITNLGYQCSARLAAQRRVDKGIEAWRYRWMGVFPNQRISPDAGAWHGSEIAHVFGNADRSSMGGSVRATENQLKVSELMNKAWGVFAKDPKKGLNGLGWPTYNEKENTLILLAENNGPGATFVQGGKFDAECNRISNNIPGVPGMGI
ncbi:alpha/beta-hydrolase [Tothia fuscella]|uniref:Carboxylic ester hydrolase n=1 Tax=Tothia fuscella TaxID=1048955 RepID=A0A9P4NT58_9PEZI|nr:alpha/beta-hydrolase [Tothia fuscella]